MQVTADRVFNVFFLCTHTSARSVVAECVMNWLGKWRFKGYSAGSAPSGGVLPTALDLLKSFEYDISKLRSKSWDDFAVPGAQQMDFIITVCDSAANETCPMWPGHPASAHWGLPDPSAAEGIEAEKRLAFAEMHRLLSRPIGGFVNLPLASLDHISLKKRLEEIGEIEGSTSSARV
jgi:arsenate reductase